MSNILDQRFRLTPVEPENVTPIEQNVTPVVESQTQGDDSGMQEPEERQGESPEDTATDERMGELLETINGLQKQLAEMQEQQAKHSQALERFVKYSPLPKEEGKQEQEQGATLAQDVPPAFTPLQEMDFSRDGKF